MSNGKRGKKSGVGLGPSNGSAAPRGIILIVVASVLGILLLWKGIDGPTSDVVGPSSSSPTTTVVEADSDNGEGGEGEGSESDLLDITGDPTTTTTTTLFPPTPPAEVQVLVANGSGISGGAGTVTDMLIPQGYTTLPTANAILTSVSGIYFRTGMSQEARVIQEYLAPDYPNVLMQIPDDGLEVPDSTADRVEQADVVIILGSDGVILAE